MEYEESTLSETSLCIESFQRKRASPTPQQAREDSTVKEEAGNDSDQEEMVQVSGIFYCLRYNWLW